MEYGIIRGLCWYRIFAALWAACIVIFSYNKMVYPSYATMAAGALVILSLTIQQISRRDPSILMRREIVISELLFALLVTLLGGYVYKHGTSSTTLAFASQYILASALMAGVAFGMSGGLIAGAANDFLTTLKEEFPLGEERTRALEIVSAMCRPYREGMDPVLHQEFMRAARDATRPIVARGVSVSL